MDATISLSPAISEVSVAIFASASAMRAESSATLSSLSTLEVLLFSSSKSHQFLWLSSSFCSSMRRKIIFWIMLFTSSKGPVRWAETCCARRSRARECVLAASARSSCNAFVAGPALPSWRKDTGEGGGTGFEEGSVRTPVALLRISTAAAMASSSPLRTAERSAHSEAFNSQPFCVLAREAESASSSACSEVRLFCASFRSPVTSPSSFSLLALEAVAASFVAWRACSSSS
mmetsp:Transcript_40471/g.88487  ORF Transcript_40471/g.88487 Transcript_40471/m.88487 type:complete len:232 (+) Transcript_40471:876-1571(+)